MTLVIITVTMGPYPSVSEFNYSLISSNTGILLFGLQKLLSGERWCLGLYHRNTEFTQERSTPTPRPMHSVT